MTYSCECRKHRPDLWVDVPSKRPGWIKTLCVRCNRFIGWRLAKEIK